MGIVVAHIEPVGGHAGMDYYDYGILNGLISNGITPHLYTCDLTPYNEDYDRYTHRTFKKIYGKQPKILRGIYYIFGLFSTMLHSKTKGATLHHYHFFHSGPIELISVFLSKVFFNKVIITLHDLSSLIGNDSVFIKWLIYNLSDAIVVQSHTCKKEFLHSNTINSSKVFVIPPGNYCHAIALDDQNSCKKLLGIDPALKVILFFGQIKQVKGLDILIHAVGKLAHSRNDFVLVIAGRPWKDDMTGYEELINHYKMTDKCKLFPRFISDSEMGTFYNSADIVCVPYTKSYYSAVLLMGMSYRKVVLASDLPIFHEIVENGTDALLFNVSDPNHMATQLDTLLSDDKMRLEISTNAHQKMATRFSWHRVGHDLMSLYQSLQEKK